MPVAVVGIYFLTVLLFQRLIEMCSGHFPTPSETDEVKFLFTLSAQLRKNPNLVYIYMTQVTIVY